jgi:crotonobetainyl-CoA:carnitine CoA-transferase CaiB-like acyl-CoA transferase
LIREYDHPEVGRLTLMGVPLTFTASPASDAGPPPVLGEHTDEVLRELGYTDAAIDALGRDDVVRRGGKA